MRITCCSHESNEASSSSSLSHSFVFVLHRCHELREKERRRESQEAGKHGYYTDRTRQLSSLKKKPGKNERAIGLVKSQHEAKDQPAKPRTPPLTFYVFGRPAKSIRGPRGHLTGDPLKLA